MYVILYIKKTLLFQYMIKYKQLTKNNVYIFPK